MTSWPGLGILAGAEITVFFAATVKAFSAQARISREHDNDIRAAIAGYEAGRVIPALAKLVEDVAKTKRQDESFADALNRADVGELFGGAVEASVLSKLPRARETNLVHRYTALGGCLLGCQLAGPVALYNILTSGYNLSHTVVIVATVIFSFAFVGALALAVAVGLAERRLARVIREGKDAA